MSIRVMLAEDHALVRQGVRALLEREGFVVVAEASDGQEAVRLASELHPDVAVLDLSMPVRNGLDAAREIEQASRRTRTILLTRHDEDQFVVEAIRAGAKGYVLKSQAATDLVDAIRQVSGGGVYLSPSVSRAVVDAYRGGSQIPPEPLTLRERQVLQLIGEGKSTKAIAVVLGIATKTAESHRTRLMQKLDIHEKAGLVRYAIRRGLVQP